MSLHACAGCSTAYAVGLEVCPNCGSAERLGGGTVLPYLDVACGSPGCRAFSRVRRMYLRQVTPGVVEMPGVLVCVPCGAGMGAVRSWEDDMPKITRHGGATNAAADAEGARPPSDPAAPAAPDEEVASSPGSNSSTSSVRPETSPETSKPETPKRARTTGSRSKAARTGGSSARSTAGDPE